MSRDVVADQHKERLLRLAAYAEATHRLALSNLRNVFPPWRWRAWWRVHHEVQRRIAYIDRELQREGVDSG